MANVIVALSPCVVASAIIFGLRALLVTLFGEQLAGLSGCTATLKRPRPHWGSVCGGHRHHLALNMPVVMPLRPSHRDFVAIIIIEPLFGGLIGMNFLTRL